MGRKKLTEKKCPRCGIVKPRSAYYEYNSRHHKSPRIDSRCKDCSYEACRPARKRWYERNREEALKRLAQWSKDNPERAKKCQYEFNRNCVKEAKGGYLNTLFRKSTGLEPKEHPELLAAYRTQLLIKRKLNEQQVNRP